jgi:hypothetical protein
MIAKKTPPRKKTVTKAPCQESGSQNQRLKKSSCQKRNKGLNRLDLAFLIKKAIKKHTMELIFYPLQDDFRGCLCLTQQLGVKLFSYTRSIDLNKVIHCYCRVLEKTEV